MKYEQQILAAFGRLGFQPRDNQVDHVNQIAVAFLDNGAKNVILSAPTGTGKSIIGAVAAEVVHTIKRPESAALASFMLTTTNVLAQQYVDTFTRDERSHPAFKIIKGARNYECEALSTAQEPQNAESCAITLFMKTGMTAMVDGPCSGCEYRRAKAAKATARHLITNASYYFIDRLYSTHPMEKRTMCVFDEAHLFNDLFVEHNAIYVSEKRLDAMIKEVGDAVRLRDGVIFNKIKKVRDALTSGKITRDTYNAYAREMLTIYKDIASSAQAQAESNVRNPKKYLALQKISKKYFNFGCKIDDFILFGYPHVFEYRPLDVKKGQNEHEISIKPVFIGDMFEALDNAEFNLFMSATISDKMVVRTMTLPGKTEFIKLPPQFPAENKKVVFYNPMLLNYSSMQQPDTIKKLCATVWQITDHHVKKHERGIILVPSFKVGEAVAQVLKTMKLPATVFEQQRGVPLAETLDRFKGFNGDAVLITPAGFEGVDLAGDLSRFQILVKMPFASLGDARIKHICDTYPDIYSGTALQKLVQGAGRSVRSKDDWATTYILDTAAQKAWSGSANLWKDEFSTRYSSTLETHD